MLLMPKQEAAISTPTQKNAYLLALNLIYQF